MLIHAEIRLWIDSVNAHQPHQTSYTLAIYIPALLLKLCSYASVAEEGTLGIEHIDLMHELNILLAFLAIHRCSIHTRTIYLSPDFFLSQLTSTVSWPTSFSKFSCFDSYSFWIFSTSLDPISNTIEARSNNSDFHRLIMTGFNSYLAASSLTVCSSRMTSSTTFVLNSGVYWFLFSIV